MAAVRSEQRRDDVLRRAVEEGVHHVLERRFADDAARHYRQVDVLESLFLVTHMALRLQYAQLSAHGRIAGLAGKGLHEVGRRGTADLIEDVHDLPLAAGQRVKCYFHNGSRRYKNNGLMSS